MFDYDLLVIGAGPGGLAASEQAAGYGARVAIAEQSDVGGACVIRGCIPEKLMAYAASFSQSPTDAVGYGWSQVRSTFDWQQFMSAKESEIQRLSQVHRQSLEDAKVEILPGKARFVDPHTLTVADTTVTADRILIAVGATAVKPTISGIEHAIAAPELFQLKQQPKHIAIIGNDYISVKFAGILQELGSQVTQIISEDLVLAGMDKDLRVAVQSGMEQHGVTILDRTWVNAIEPGRFELHLHLAGVHSEPLAVDTVLYSTGRTANVSSLELDRVGVKVSEGFIEVDTYSHTTQPHIFAVGDCTNCLELTPVAIAKAKAFANTEFGDHRQVVDNEFIPIVVSHYPEAAAVGLSEAQAREKFGDAVCCCSNTFRSLFYNLAERDEQALIKLVLEEPSGRILGAHMVGNGASEIVQCVAIALRMGATKKDLDTTIGVHPSSGEELFSLSIRR